MAAPILRHYRTSPAAGATVAVVPAVPAARALVVGAVVVACRETAAGDYKFSLRVGPAGATDGDHAVQVVLKPGQTYVEKGLVVLAGEVVEFVNHAGGGSFACNVHGEEVDN